MFSTCACFANIIVAVCCRRPRCKNQHHFRLAVLVLYMLLSRPLHPPHLGKIGNIVHEFFFIPPFSVKTNTCLTLDKVFCTCLECNPTNFIIKCNGRTSNTYSQLEFFFLTPNTRLLLLLHLLASIINGNAHFNINSTYNSNDNIISHINNEEK